ncbi:MAG: DUF692 domain-containing protein [Rhodospirillales bacterium]|nr:DUF692 domain-containing protein [Rhodospirillales bacterium]
MVSGHSDIPARVGVGLKPQHYRDILESKPAIGWFEVHPENYMGEGGAPLARLERIREQYPLSLHSVGLSVGGSGDLDGGHLNRLAAVIERYEPGLVSEHLAWSTHQGHYFNDLLAVPYTRETLAMVCDHIDQVQNRLGRHILLENPATYITFENSTFDEIDFISAITRQTDCTLLLDVNNVYVSCINHGEQAEDYIDRFPVDRVREIHLAGHAEDVNEHGERFLIDAHDRPVADAVWDLYARLLERTGSVPTLIEWDNDIPDWQGLYNEAMRATAVMERITGATGVTDVTGATGADGTEKSNVA